MADRKLRRLDFVPRDEEADRLAQQKLTEAHHALIEATRAALQAGWGTQIRDDMEGASALVSHVRRAFQ